MATKKTKTKTAAKKPALKKRTVSLLNDKSVTAAMQDTLRPVIIISGGCATDFTKVLATDITRIMMTDITRVKTK